MIHNRHQPESAATSRQLLQASHHAPITSNGVGTHYHGKKHRTIRHAVCRHCGHQAELTSYETRLWFVFMFIPLIPLGRKRIVDECKLCDRHESMPAQYWDNVRQSATVAATERFQEEQSEQSALEVHATLLEFQQHAEAQQFRSTMLDRFSDKPLLHTGLAMHLERIGLPEEANKLWDRAWQLDPELPEARVGMGRRRMSDRQLDAARELIAFLLEPGAEHDHDLAPTLELARHYQDAGEHEKSVEIMKILVTASPEFCHVHQIRTAINKLETAEREEDSILPTIETSPSKLSSPQRSSGQRRGLAITVGLVTVGAAIHNESIRRHRPLIVINDTGVAASIQIDDRPAVSVIGKQTLAIAEGRHTVKVFGPVEEQHVMEVTSRYWERWSLTPVWIVNVGGEAIILDMQVYYAANPREPDIRYCIEQRRSNYGKMICSGL